MSVDPPGTRARTSPSTASRRSKARSGPRSAEASNTSLGLRDDLGEEAELHPIARRGGRHHRAQRIPHPLPPLPAHAARAVHQEDNVHGLTRFAVRDEGEERLELGPILSKRCPTGAPQPPSPSEDEPRERGAGQASKGHVEGDDHVRRVITEQPRPQVSGPDEVEVDAVEGLPLEPSPSRPEAASPARGLGPSRLDDEHPNRSPDLEEPGRTIVLREEVGDLGGQGGEPHGHPELPDPGGERGQLHVHGERTQARGGPSGGGHRGLLAPPDRARGLHLRGAPEAKLPLDDQRRLVATGG